MSADATDTIDPRVLAMVLDEAAGLEGDADGHLTDEELEYLERVAAEAVAEFAGAGGQERYEREWEESEHPRDRGKFAVKPGRSKANKKVGAEGGRPKGEVHQSKVAPPEGAGRMSSPEEHAAAVEMARKKFADAPAPTAKEVAEAAAGLAAMGANKYRKGLVGNSADRRRRRVALMVEFGDGETCPCIYCGIKVGEGSLEQDKIYTTAEGGRYRTPNLVPSCSDCNKRRSDMPFAEAMEKVVRHAGTTA